MLKTLNPMSFDGTGVSQTCVSILNGISTTSLKGQLYAVRARQSQHNNFNEYYAFANFIARTAPYKLIKRYGERRTEDQFFRDLEKYDIAYLWPAASLRSHEVAAEMGCKIVLEGINTKMSNAKTILDRAYESIGCKPEHGITKERIYEEERKLDLATAIFAPSNNVSRSFADYCTTTQIFETSYGINLASSHPPKRKVGSAEQTFLFVGYLCVRKGGHLLLDAWRGLDLTCKLVIAGKIEKTILKKYSDVLNQQNVECLGFVRDVKSRMIAAKCLILPSLEEGDPIVIYEAASVGLPIISSPAGAGRLGERENTMYILRDMSSDSIRLAITQAQTSPEMFEFFAETSAKELGNFSWQTIGRARKKQIESLVEYS